MKKIIKIMMFCIVMVVLAVGCGINSNSGHKGNNNNVDNVLNQQVNNADKNTTTDADNEVATNEPVADNTTNSEEEHTYTLLNDSDDNTATTKDVTTEADPEVDYDLTTMGSDMVYATVYQLMVNPDEYVGKTFKMNGLYYASYYEPTSKYYNYCIIKDAMACCAQGLEFVCEDESLTYPDDYPTENAEITVTGTFEKYQEEGDTNLYCRLSNATMEVEK